MIGLTSVNDSGGLGDLEDGEEKERANESDDRVSLIPQWNQCWITLYLY